MGPGDDALGFRIFLSVEVRKQWNRGEITNKTRNLESFCIPQSLGLFPLVIASQKWPTLSPVPAQNCQWQCRPKTMALKQPFMRHRLQECPEWMQSQAWFYSDMRPPERPSGFGFLGSPASPPQVLIHRYFFLVSHRALGPIPNQTDIPWSFGLAAVQCRPTWGLDTWTSARRRCNLPPLPQSLPVSDNPGSRSTSALGSLCVYVLLLFGFCLCLLNTVWVVFVFLSHWPVCLPLFMWAGVPFSGPKFWSLSFYLYSS